MEYVGERLEQPEKAKRVRRGSIDLPFALLTLMLLSIGVIMVLSASYARAYYSALTGHNAAYYFKRQFLFALGGIVAMLVASCFTMKFYRKWSPALMVLSLAALAAVPIIGYVGGGSRRWIDLGVTTVQPSEIVKVAVILYFAAMICKNKGQMRTFKRGILPFAVILVVIIGLLALEPHFSAAIIISVIGGVMLFLGGARLIWFLLAGIAGGGGIYVIMTFFDYTSDRISAWQDPFSAPADSGYQIIQSLYAIGSGGLFGVGLGQGRQKMLYLPEEHNDYIFSVVCEELGFVGAVAILLLFMLLIMRGYWLAMHMTDRYSFLVTAGITTLLAIQVVLNVAVVTNLIPSTGVSLPFFSYGGTALLIQMTEIGVVLSASRDIPAKVAG